MVSKPDMLTALSTVSGTLCRLDLFSFMSISSLGSMIEVSALAFAALKLVVVTTSDLRLEALLRWPPDDGDEEDNSCLNNDAMAAVASSLLL
jgi:hypothetical protein